MRPAGLSDRRLLLYCLVAATVPMAVALGAPVDLSGVRAWGLFVGAVVVLAVLLFADGYHRGRG